MIDLQDLLQYWCDQKEYTLILDTPSGINQSADNNNHLKICWLNIIENANISTRANQIVLNRQIEINLYQEVIKEDDGKVDYSVLQGLRADLIHLYAYLDNSIDDISNVSVQTGVDEMDACMAMVNINLSFPDICSCVDTASHTYDDGYKAGYNDGYESAYADAYKKATEESAATIEELNREISEKEEEITSLTDERDSLIIKVNELIEELTKFYEWFCLTDKYESVGYNPNITMTDKEGVTTLYNDAVIGNYYRITSYTDDETTSVVAFPGVTGIINLTYANPTTFVNDVDVLKASMPSAKLVAGSNLKDLCWVSSGDTDLTNITSGDYNDFTVLSSGTLATPSILDGYKVNNLWIEGVANNTLVLPQYVNDTYRVASLDAEFINSSDKGTFIVNDADKTPKEIVISGLSNISTIYLQMPVEGDVSEYKVTITDCPQLTVIYNDGQKLDESQVTITGCDKLKNNQLLKLNIKYLKVTNTGSSTGTITWAAGPSINGLVYAVDNEDEWNDYSLNTAITLDAGQYAAFRAKTVNPTFSTGDSNYIHLTTTGSTYNVEGDVTTLINQEGNVDDLTAYGTCTFDRLFTDCTNVTFDGIEFPSTILSNDCYNNTFQNSGITVAPELPATTLGGNCYNGLFKNCKNLVKAMDILPATDISSMAAVYPFMFQNCTSLEKAPEIYGLTVTNLCFYYMFQGCSKLNYIKVHVTSWDGGSSRYWVSGVSSSGTFVKPASTSISTGPAGIPSGWTVETY